MCDTKNNWFSRAKAIVAAFALAAVFFVGFLALKQMVQNGLRVVATGIIPNHEDELYHDIAASAALVIP